LLKYHYDVLLFLLIKRNYGMNINYQNDELKHEVFVSIGCLLVDSEFFAKIKKTKTNIIITFFHSHTFYEKHYHQNYQKFSL
jgi:hypothetical protein